MSIRSAVTALGATLAVAVMLTSTTTPAFAAKSKNEEAKPPTVVETQNTKPKTDQGRPPSYATRSNQLDDEEIAGFGSGPGPGNSQDSGPATASPTSSQGQASSSTIGTTFPGIPAGSVVPSGMFGPAYQQGPAAPYQAMVPTVSASTNGAPYQQGSTPVPNPDVAGPTYQQGSEPASNGGPTGAAYQPTPGPLFLGPLPGTVQAGTGPESQQGSSLTVNAIDSGSQSPARPDVRVVYVDTASNSTSTLFHFRVDNAGSQPATAISLGSVIREQSDTSSATRRVEEQHAQIATLTVGQAQDVVVTCTPRSGFRCVSGTLDASAANDGNPANNSAHS